MRVPRLSTAGTPAPGESPAPRSLLRRPLRTSGNRPFRAKKQRPLTLIRAGCILRIRERFPKGTELSRPEPPESGESRDLPGHSAGLTEEVNPSK